MPYTVIVEFRCGARYILSEILPRIPEKIICSPAATTELGSTLIDIVSLSVARRVAMSALGKAGMSRFSFE